MQSPRRSYQLASPRDVLWRDLGASLERVALGFAIALLLALVLGSLVGGSRVAERALDPPLRRFGRATRAALLDALGVLGHAAAREPRALA